MYHSPDRQGGVGSERSSPFLIPMRGHHASNDPPAMLRAAVAFYFFV